ncbi:MULTISPECIES: glycosyltransferase [Paenibacillus]|nr:glycosyltransferase [Paenibacillus sp. IHBB 10380]
MKILYVVHQFFPEYTAGTERVVMNLSSMSQKNGHQVKVISYSSYPDSFYDQKIGEILFKEFIYNGVSIIAFKSLNEIVDLNISLWNTQFSEFTKFILLRELPDIIHITHFMRVGEFAKSAQELGIPYIVTLTDFYLLCPKVVLTTTSGELCAGPAKGSTCHKLCSELPSELISTRLETAKEILNNAHKILAPSVFVAEIFLREMPQLDIQVIHHGISNNFTKKNKKIYSSKAVITFCYAGSITKHKGVHLLIDAFKRIEANNVKLNIFGSVADQDYFNYIVNEIKDDSRIQYCGQYSNEEIGDIFSNIDMLIIPSICYESYSLVLHEALKSRVPVIASNIGSIPENIMNGINGLTFKFNDSVDLMRKMNDIATNPEQINTFKNNIKERLIPFIEQEAYNYGKLYNEVIQ